MPMLGAPIQPRAHTHTHTQSESNTPQEAFPVVTTLGSRNFCWARMGSHEDYTMGLATFCHSGIRAYRLAPQSRQRLATLGSDHGLRTTNRVPCMDSMCTGIPTVVEYPCTRRIDMTYD